MNCVIKIVELQKERQSFIEIKRTIIKRQKIVVEKQRIPLALTWTGLKLKYVENEIKITSQFQEFRIKRVSLQA